MPSTLELKLWLTNKLVDYTESDPSWMLHIYGLVPHSTFLLKNQVSKYG